MSDLLSDEVLHVGANPFAHATPAAAQVESPPAPASPPVKPSVWDRVAGIFARKRTDAKTTYLRLLKRCEVDGKPLTDHEVGELATAMETAGVTEEQSADHRDLIRRWRETKIRADRLPGLKKKKQETESAVADLNLQIDRLLAKRHPHDLVAEELRFNLPSANSDASQFANLDTEVRQLFGE